jgi:hypothetical protein
MPQGLSLHIGVNAIDPAHYSGWSGELAACEFDAESMLEIAQQRGFKAASLITAQATRKSVADAICGAASRLVAGDIFVVSYAGHGGQVPDKNGDEPDSTDETWCLYDGMLIDDELHGLWGKFASGVRVLVVSDSCHSGTVTRAAQGGLNLKEAAEQLKAYGIDKPRFRFMPPAEASKTYRANKAFYDELGRSLPADMPPQAATVRLISGCQDDQLSSDGTFNGLFTATLVKVWNNGKFDGDYAAFHSEIIQRMPPIQQPNHFVIGPPAAAFDRQRPFDITG